MLYQTAVCQPFYFVLHIYTTIGVNLKQPQIKIIFINTIIYEQNRRIPIILMETLAISHKNHADSQEAATNVLNICQANRYFKTSQILLLLLNIISQILFNICLEFSEVASIYQHLDNMYQCTPTRLQANQGEL